MEIGCPVANSDHYTTMFKTSRKDTVLRCKKETRCYNKANYYEICRQLLSVPCESLVERQDVKQEWFAINGELLRCVYELVPKKEEINKKQPLWMKSRTKKLIIIIIIFFFYALGSKDPEG